MPIVVGLTKRNVKGSPLTHNEVDANWTAIENGFAQVPDAVTANNPNTHGIRLQGQDVQEVPYSNLPAA